MRDAWLEAFECVESKSVNSIEIPTIPYSSSYTTTNHHERLHGGGRATSYPPFPLHDLYPASFNIRQALVSQLLRHSRYHAGNWI